MQSSILSRIRREGFEPLGWFVVQPGDALPHPARFVVLIGNAGPEMFQRFAVQRDAARDSLDDWTRSTVDGLSRDLGARAVYPFDQPFLPFLSWARRGGGGHVSPLGLNIHPRYGLWHAYRAALLFADALDWPAIAGHASPCDDCTTRPCLGACPVRAFDGERFDVAACRHHLRGDAAQTCDPAGCRARCACPVGMQFRYEPRQMAFHMRAFRLGEQQ